jgi:lipopolysaccharide transport protein LptA
MYPSFTKLKLSIAFITLLLQVSLHANFESLYPYLKKINNKELYRNNSKENDIFITAKSFEIDLNRNKISGKNDVNVSQNDLFLKANTLLYDIRTKQLDLKQQVTVTKKLLTIQADSAKAKLPKNVRLLNGTTFSFKDFKGNSKEAEYDVDTQVITLLDNAKVVQGTNIVNGDTILFDVKKESIRSEGRAKIKFSTEQ